MKYFLSFCIFLIMLVNVAHSAQIYKESSKVVYKKFSGSAKQEIMQLAFNQACSKAVSRHAESLDKSQYANYKKVKTKIENNLELSGLYPKILCQRDNITKYSGWDPSCLTAIL